MKITIKPWFALLGFLGFLGFLYFPLGDPDALVFFAFFGLFSFYYYGKLAKEMQDERLQANAARASSIAYRVGFGIVFTMMIFVNNRWGRTNPTLAYHSLLAGIALAYALMTNLAAYLTYRFDKREV